MINYKYLFLKNLITLDLFVTESFLKEKLKSQTTAFIHFEKKNIVVLDPIRTIMRLKQLINIVKFVKNKNRYSIKVWFNNEDTFTMFNYIAHKKTITNFKFSCAESRLIKLNIHCGIMDKYFSIKNRNEFLNFLINDKFMSNSLDIYKLYNNFENIKKLIFLDLLLKKI